MCTVVVAVGAGPSSGVFMAANRDERTDRAWDPPAEHWPEHPGVIAGRDRSGGGTWLGLNAQGVIAAVLNRTGSLGPAPGKRSRGALPLIALAHGTAIHAVAALAALDAGDWRSFNMVVADRDGAWFVRGLEQGAPEAVRLASGVHMITAHDVDDPASPRVSRHLPRFRAAASPETDGWAAWLALLADRSGPPRTELNVPWRGGFGTVCASLLGLHGDGGHEFLFAPGPPDHAAFQAIPARDSPAARVSPSDGRG